jgi:hypothetical protein
MPLRATVHEQHFAGLKPPAETLCHLRKHGFGQRGDPPCSSPADGRGSEAATTDLSGPPASATRTASPGCQRALYFEPLLLHHSTSLQAGTGWYIAGPRAWRMVHRGRFTSPHPDELVRAAGWGHVNCCNILSAPPGCWITMQFINIGGCFEVIAVGTLAPFP